MRVDCNTAEVYGFLVLDLRTVDDVTADDTRNVGTVFAVVGEHVGVLVGVVVHEWNFVAVIQVVDGNAACVFGCVKQRQHFLLDCAVLVVDVLAVVVRVFDVLQSRLGKQLHNLLSGDCQFAILKRTPKYFVAAVETGVQNGNRRLFAGVAYAVRLVNTCLFVHVDDVVNGVVTAASACTCGLRFVVGVRQNDVFDATEGFQVVNLAVGRPDGNGVEQCAVNADDFRNKSLGLHLVHKCVLTVGNGYLFGCADAACRVLGNRAVAVTFRQIVVNQRVAVQRGDDRHLVAVLVTVVFDQVFRLDF